MNLADGGRGGDGRRSIGAEFHPPVKYRLTSLNPSSTFDDGPPIGQGKANVRPSVRSSAECGSN